MSSLRLRINLVYKWIPIRVLIFCWVFFFFFLSFLFFLRPERYFKDLVKSRRKCLLYSCKQNRPFNEEGILFITKRRWNAKFNVRVLHSCIHRDKCKSQSSRYFFSGTSPLNDPRTYGVFGWNTPSLFQSTPTKKRSTIHGPNRSVWDSKEFPCLKLPSWLLLCRMTWIWH